MMLNGASYDWAKKTVNFREFFVIIFFVQLYLVEFQVFPLDISQ